MDESPEQFLTINWPVEGGFIKIISPDKSNVKLTVSQLDNEVLIDAKSNFLRVGEFVSAKIYEASDFDLYASV